MANDKLDNPLDSFTLDNDTDFFGIKAGKTDTVGALVETVKQTSLAEFEEELPEEEGAVTNFEEDKKGKGKAKPVEEEVTTTTKPVKKEVKKVDTNNTKDENATDEEDEENEEKDVKFFEEEEKETKSVVKRDKDGKPVKEVKVDPVVEASSEEYFTALATDLVERGLLKNVELEADKQYTEEEFFDLINADREAEIDETIEALFESFDQEAKDFIKFKRDGGGNTLEFLNQYVNPFTMETLDEENPEQRQKVISHYLATVEKADSEEIKDRLEYLKESGKDKTVATKYFKILKDTAETNRKAILKDAKDDAIARAENAKKFATSLVTIAGGTDTVGMFPISKTEQKDIPAYITKPTVKTGKDSFIPEFSRDLSRILKAETPEDKKELLILAKLVKNKFKVDDLKIVTETKVTKEAQSKLRQAKEGVKVHSSGASGRKQLSDYFQDE